MSDDHVAMETPDVEIAVEPEIEEEAAETVPNDTTKEAEEAKLEATRVMALERVAEEIREGKWGVGQERRNRLSEAGYNVKACEEAYYKLIRGH